MEAGTTTVTRAPGAPALGASRRRIGETVIKGLLLLAALISVLTTTGIVLSLLTETINFFRQVGVVDFLFGTEWSPLFADPSFGVVPLVTGTLLATFIA